MCFKNQNLFFFFLRLHENKREKKMIQLNKDFYPIIYITFKDSDWNFEDYTNIIQIIEEQLNESITKKETIKLVIDGKAELTTSPSLQSYTWIVKDLFRLRSLLAVAIDRTVILTSGGSLKTFFDVILQLYTPVKPLKIFEIYDEAYTWLNSGA
jgi:hypothetical protein